MAFSDRIREEKQQVNKDDLLKQVRDLVGTLKKINCKLSKVFEYHQVRKFAAAKWSRQVIFVPLLPGHGDAPREETALLGVQETPDDRPHPPAQRLHQSVQQRASPTEFAAKSTTLAVLKRVATA